MFDPLQSLQELYADDRGDFQNLYELALAADVDNLAFQTAVAAADRAVDDIVFATMMLKLYRAVKSSMVEYEQATTRRPFLRLVDGPGRPPEEPDPEVA